MTTYYVDYENGNDTIGDGLAWGTAYQSVDKALDECSAGDTIKVAKTSDPVSIGNATWTHKSNTVTLAAAQTLTIDNCEVAWTGGGDKITPSQYSSSPYPRQGTYFAKFACDSGISANTLQAYYKISDSGIDFSSYQKISFWFQDAGRSVAENNWVIALCSDDAGATPVDTFKIPPITQSGRWARLTLTKEGGGNLGSAIKSIALYTGSSTTGITGTGNLYMDNVFACTTNGLNLLSLISKNNDDLIEDTAWYPVRSVDGTTIIIDNAYNTQIANLIAYYTTGDSPENVTTYARESYHDYTSVSSTSIFMNLDESGSSGNPITIQGGVNTSDDEQDGMTSIYCVNSSGKGLQLAASYIDISNFIFSYFYYSVYASAGGKQESYITNIMTSGSVYGFYLDAYTHNFKNLRAVGHSSGLILSESTGGNLYENIYAFCNNQGFGVDSRYDYIENLIVYNAYYYPIVINSKTYHVIINGAIAKGGLWTADFHGFTYKDANCVFKNFNLADGSNGDLRISSGDSVFIDFVFGDGESLDWTDTEGQYCENVDGETFHVNDLGRNTMVDTDREGGTGSMWQIPVSSSCRYHSYAHLTIAKIAVVANKLVTVNAWVKKSHATNIDAFLVCSVKNIGISEDASDTKTDDTDWEELEITFTPTEAGVVEIEVLGEYISGTGNIYVEDLTITQAD